MNAAMVRSLCLVLVAFALLPLLVAPVSAGEQPGPPTVGGPEIVSYDCDTGRLVFRTAVTDLARVEGAAGSTQASYLYSITSEYPGGTVGTFDPIPVQAFARPLFQGEVVDTITVDVSVGAPGFLGTSSPSDTASTTVDPDCGDTPSTIYQLIDILLNILRDILGD